MMPLKVVDLFSGCGGLAWGFQETGFEVLLGADINPVALKTFARNFAKTRTLETDLSALRPRKILDDLQLKSGELDCLIGGPPCQGFSKNVPARRRWRSDPRNALILTFLEFVKVLKPKVVLLENVAEMLNAYNEAFTNEILDILGGLGYEATNARLLAADYGVPQLRRRAFFFANRINAPVKIPHRSHALSRKDQMPLGLNGSRPYVSVWQAISDLPSLSAGEKGSPAPYPKYPETEYQQVMRAQAVMMHDHDARPLTRPQLERVGHLKPGSGEGVESLPKRLRPRSGYSGAYARLFPDEPARTITRWVFHPGSGRFYHPFDNRVITIREAARLQSFPDRFVFEGTYIQKSHQVGEAVPPLMARHFAEYAKAALLGKSPANLFDEVGQ